MTAFVFVSMPSAARAATGEGTATIGGGSSQTVEISSSNVFTVVLTVGASGIATDAAGPTFTIPTGFTAPHASGGASVPTQVSEVDVDGEWFAAGAGGTCAVTMGSSSATGQIITVDVTGACASTNTITLTYKGSASATASAAAALTVKTADTSGNGAATSIASSPTIAVKGTAVFASHATAGVATTNNLAGLAGVGGVDKVIGGFKITAAGENVSVTTIRTTVTLGTMTASELTNLRIVPDDGSGGGVANDGTMQAGELSAALATITSPVSGNNDFTVTSTVTGGSSKNYFVVGTIASTVSDADTLDVEATGAGSVAAGVTSAVAITATGTSSNSTRTVTDTTAPTITSIVLNDSTHITVTFNEQVTTPGTSTTNNWTVGGGTTTPTITAVSDIHATPATTEVLTISGYTGGSLTLLYTTAGSQDITDTSAALNALVTTSAAAVSNLPTVSIGLSDVNLGVGEKMTITFTFSTAPTGFTVADITAPNGTLGAIDATNPLVQTVVFTPNANTMISSNVITVGTDWTDASLNHPASSMTSGNYSINTVSSGSHGGGSSGPNRTSIIAQSPVPITFEVAPGITETTNSPGCSGGNKYNTSTGAVCVNNIGRTDVNANANANFSASAGRQYNFGSVILKSGSRGAAVMELQRFLNAKLGLSLTIDGKLGPKTIAIIKRWQKDHGLAADGVIGAKTKARMNAEAE